MKPRDSRSLLRPFSRPPRGLWLAAAAFGLLLGLTQPAAAAGPAPDQPPPGWPGGGAPAPDAPAQPQPEHTVTRAVTPVSQPRTAARPATVRTVVVVTRPLRVTPPSRPRARARPRHVSPKPVRQAAPRPHVRVAAPAPDRRPPYGLVALAAALAVLGAGSLAVTVSSVRAGAT